MKIFLIAGEAYIISMISKMVIHTYRFHQKVKCVKFSPDGKHFAVCKGNNGMFFIWYVIYIMYI